MRCKIQGTFSQTHLSRLEQAGYEWHCIEKGQLCFHRTLADVPLLFPRFHLLIRPLEDQYEFSLHFDQYSVDHKSNHTKPWAYRGTRVQEEFHRLIDLLIKTKPLPTVSQPNLGFVPKKLREKKTVSKNGNGRPWKWKPIVRL